MTTTCFLFTILPAHTNHTSSNQLLHLDPNVRIAHVLLQRRRVALGLLENALHDRVLEDGHDIRVALNALLRRLLALTLAGRELCLQRLLALLLNLARVLAVRVVLRGSRAHVQALVVFLHREQRLGFAQVGANEFGIAADGLVAVVDGRWEG